jgi:hypothetical protein
MDDNHRKEQFSRAHIHALAAAAGCQICRSDVDAKSVDLTIRADGPHGPVLLDVQVKCTAQRLPLPDPIPFPLKRKNYDDLRIHPRSYPIILAVLIVPEDGGRWLEPSEDEWLGRHACFWLSLRGCAPLDEGATSRTVHLPKQHQLTPAELERLMTRVLLEEPL